MGTTNRITGRRLQRRRQIMLDHNPLCVQCEREGRVRAATEIDHIVPLFKGGEDTADNCQPLCTECHAAKTDKDMGRMQKGCDENGIPLDPQHHWHKG